MIFDKDDNLFFQQIVLEHTVWGERILTLPHTIHKTSKCITDQTVKDKIPNFLEYYLGENLHDLEISKDFFRTQNFTVQKNLFNWI